MQTADQAIRHMAPRYYYHSTLVCTACAHEWGATYTPGEAPGLWSCPACQEDAGIIRSARDTKIYGTLVCDRCDSEFDRIEMRPGARFPLVCPRCDHAALRLHPDVRLAKA